MLLLFSLVPVVPSALCNIPRARLVPMLVSSRCAFVRLVNARNSSMIAAHVYVYVCCGGPVLHCDVFSRQSCTGERKRQGVEGVGGRCLQRPRMRFAARNNSNLVCMCVRARARAFDHKVFTALQRAECSELREPTGTC